VGEGEGVFDVVGDVDCVAPTEELGVGVGVDEGEGTGCGASTTPRNSAPASAGSSSVGVQVVGMMIRHSAAFTL